MKLQVAIGLGVGHFLYQMFRHPPDWDAALDRAFFSVTAIAILAFVEWRRAAERTGEQ